MGELFHTEESSFMFYTLENTLKKIAMDIRATDDEKEIEILRKKGLSYAYNIFVKSIESLLKILILNIMTKTTITKSKKI